jgi:hypothetical protein
MMIYYDDNCFCSYYGDSDDDRWRWKMMMMDNLDDR